MRGGETGVLCLQTQSGRVQQEFKGEMEGVREMG